VVMSTRNNKKYDVYKHGKYVLSFGDMRYQHYKDKLGNYSNLDHNDEVRRKKFRDRFGGRDHNNPDKALYWSWNYLW
jgi:hypothetical protein